MALHDEGREPEIDAFAALLAAARDGSDWAWRALYRELAPAVVGYLRAHRVRDADDVAGEVWVQVFRRIGTFDGTATQFRSWLFVIAHRRMLDAHRRCGRERSVPVASPEPAVGAPSAEHDGLLRLAGEQALAVLDRLEGEQRDVLVLRLVAGLTVAEVADVLGKSEGAVKAAQRRGLAAVRRISPEQGVPL